MTNIHPTAIVSEKAKIGKNVTIGAFSIIHDHAEIGDESSIDSYCEIGIESELAHTSELSIGKNSKIRSHSSLYAGSKLGDNFVSGHYVTIRENSMLGKNVQLGSRGDIQGDCTIGDYTKMHADVHIGKESKIGKYVWMFPEVLLTNDPIPPSNDLLGVTVGDFVVLAAKVLLHPGVKVDKDAVVSAGSVVKTDINEGELYAGNPAKFICPAKILRCPNDVKTKAYPWRYRFNRGYDENDVLSWLREIN